MRSSNDAARLVVEVSDTGVGITQPMLERLFDAFEQSEESRKMGGLGLGLSISKSLMEMRVVSSKGVQSRTSSRYE